LSGDISGRGFNSRRLHQCMTNHWCEWLLTSRGNNRGNIIYQHTQVVFYIEGDFCV